MPRPKVAPEDRQRVPRACQPCQSSKKRCDGQLPCGLCVRHERERECEYPASSSRTAARPAPYPGPQHRPRIGTRTSSLGRQRATRRADITPSYDSSTPSQSSPQTTSQLVYNSKGERVFIGDGASLSFLHFLRRVLRQHIGPSTFTESPTEVMLEAQPQRATPGELADDSIMHGIYLDHFMAASSGLIDLYSEDELDAMLAMYLTSHADTSSAADILLIMAIGAQCRNLQTDDHYARAFFERGRELAFQGMLEDPSLSMVRSFLLLVMYMLGACQRNAACLYLGIAAKAASIVGLHQIVECKNMPASEAQVRLRVLKSLRVLDILVNTILGRQISLLGPPSSPDMCTTDSLDATGAPLEALNATAKLCIILEKASTQLSGSDALDVGKAENILSQLRDCLDSLPRELRSIKASGVDSRTYDQLRVMIGNVHIACIYYFAVIHVSRPFLITSIVWKMSKDSQRELPTLTVKEDTLRLAEVCIDSAMLMAAMSYEAQKSGILLANMFILKAWVFLAGLVLGFAICAQVSECPGIEEAFTQAREVLQMLSHASPLAKEYHQILGRFAEAIKGYREQAAQARWRKSKRFIDKALVFDDAGDDLQEQPYLDMQPASVASNGQSMPGMGDISSNLDFFSVGRMPDTENNMGNFNQFASHINDFFPFDYESLGIDFG